MRLTSKEAVMNWYYCREVRLLQFPAVPHVNVFTDLKVLRRFRSKMHVRLTAVTFFIFLVPACSLSALGVRPHFAMLPCVLLTSILCN